MPDTRKLAQPADLMFERNFAILASKAKELRITTSNRDIYEGFASGLDDEFVQLCLTSDNSLLLINRSYIVDVVETGNTLEDLEDYDYENARMIHDKIKTFVTVSRYHDENKR